MLQREAEPLRSTAAGATARGDAALYAEARAAAQAREELAARLAAVWQQEQQLLRREEALVASEGALRQQHSNPNPNPNPNPDPNPSPNQARCASSRRCSASG